MRTLPYLLVVPVAVVVSLITGVVNVPILVLIFVIMLIADYAVWRIEHHR